MRKVLVYFIGGCTFSEIAALRMIANRDSEFNFHCILILYNYDLYHTFLKPNTVHTRHLRALHVYIFMQAEEVSIDLFCNISTHNNFDA